MKFILNAVLALFAIFTFSAGIAAVTGFDAVIVTGVVTAATMVTPAIQGVAFSGLNREIWLPDLMEGFYADDSWLKNAKDFSMHVMHNKINLAEAGVNPEVLKNNTIYPIPVSERPDTPLEIALNYYDTENTLIRNAREIELSPQRRESILYGHRQALRMFAMMEAAHNYAPQSNTTNTPVLTTTGADNGTGVKRLTFEDILAWENSFDEAEIEEEGRILVLNTKHKADLRAEDLKLYKQIMADKKLFSFSLNTLATKRLPRYHRGTGAKVAFGAVADVNDTISSIAFHKDEVCRADGTPDMFYKEKDPELRGDLIGFQKRGVYLPIRNKGISSIYSPAV